MRILANRADSGSHTIPLLLLLLCAQPSQQQTTHPSCSAPIDGQPPYEFGPEILGCFGETCMAPNIPGTPGYNPAIAPGAFNGTNVPYCEAACVIGAGATQEQINMGPSCRDFCAGSPAAAGTIENYGWCFYWCVRGEGDVVNTLSCIDAVPYHIATITEGGELVTAALLGPDTTEAASASSGSPAASSDSPASTITPSLTAMVTQKVSASGAMTSITLSPSVASAAGDSQLNAISTSKSGGFHNEISINGIASLLIAGLFLGLNL